MVTQKISGNYLKKIVTPFLMAFALSLFFSCTAQKELAKPVAEQKTQAIAAAGQFDESFDPLSLEDDDIVIKRNTKLEPSGNPAMEPLDIKSGVQKENEQTLPDSLISYQELDGFRVQIFAGRSVETATMTKSKAINDFAPYKQKVYFIFEAPFYKIRIGDFTERSKAEKARELARKLGYKEAFVVRSKVRVPKNFE